MAPRRGNAAEASVGMCARGSCGECKHTSKVVTREVSQLSRG